MYENISGTTIDASDSIIKDGVDVSIFSHVIFSLGIAPL